MAIVKYFKAKPTEHVLHFKKNKLIKSGAGLCFFYYVRTSNIIKIPINSIDLPFIYGAVSADFQPLTIQGQLTFCINEPEKIAKMFDYSIGKDGQYASDDPEKLKERLLNIAQVNAANIIAKLALDEALVSVKKLQDGIFEKLKVAESINKLGLEILDVQIPVIKASPETTKALEAKTREDLLRQSDAATYERRNAAVEQERIIKENELKTEIKIEEEKRKIRETKIAADIEIEDKRSDFVNKKVINDKKNAESQAYAVDVLVKAVKDVDWKTVTALFAGKMDSNMMISMAFRQLAENADKIGELNISPDLLKSLMNKKGN